MNKTTSLFLGVLMTAIFSPAWSLTITPGRTQVQLEPGKQIKTVLTVFNETTEPVQVEVSQKDWFVLPANKDYKISDWMKIHGSKKFILKPQKQRQVKMTLKAPKEAQGELVGMTSFLYRGETPSMVTPMISVSSYLSIDGTQKVAGEIVNLLVVDIQDHVRVLAKVKNTGNVHLRPTGTFTITSSQKEFLKDVTIPPDPAPTYPGNERDYVGEDPQFKLKPGSYVLQADLAAAGLSLRAEKAFTITPDGKVHMSEKK